jgi:hypothetical protein
MGFPTLEGSSGRETDSPLEGGGFGTIGSAKMLPTFEATPVDFFWPDLSAKKSECICDSGPTFRNPFSSANCGRRWGGPWSRRSPAIIHAKAHEPPAGGWRATPRGLFWGFALRVRLWACWFERRRLGYRQRERPIEVSAASALGMDR